MLVTAAPLVDIAPLERATMPDRVVVQFDKRDVETMKLIKLDLLGLRMLSVIDDALRDIQRGLRGLRRPRPAARGHPRGLRDDPGGRHRRRLPGGDRGPRCRRCRAAAAHLTLDDLVVEVAIIRPGPIQGNAVHPYLRRKQGLEPVTYLHPSLEPILAETLGVILYQEQVMKVAIEVGGLQPGRLRWLPSRDGHVALHRRRWRSSIARFSMGASSAAA